MQPTRLLRPWDFPGKSTGVGCHFLLQCMKVKSQNEVTQSCQTLSDPVDCSLPGSSIHGISQARVLEWGAIAFSNYILIQKRLKFLLYNFYFFSRSHNFFISISYKQANLLVSNVKQLFKQLSYKGSFFIYV